MDASFACNWNFKQSKLDLFLGMYLLDSSVFEMNSLLAPKCRCVFLLLNIFLCCGRVRRGVGSGIVIKFCKRIVSLCALFNLVQNKHNIKDNSRQKG